MLLENRWRARPWQSQLEGAIVGGRESGAREGVVKTGRGDGFVGEGRPRAGERRM